jgi:hypothetical protein
MLRQALPVARALGLPSVLLTCVGSPETSCVHGSGCSKMPPTVGEPVPASPALQEPESLPGVPLELPPELLPDVPPDPLPDVLPDTTPEPLPDVPPRSTARCGVVGGGSGVGARSRTATACPGHRRGEQQGNGSSHRGLQLSAGGNERTARWRTAFPHYTPIERGIEPSRPREGGPMAPPRARGSRGPEGR